MKFTLTRDEEVCLLVTARRSIYERLRLPLDAPRMSMSESLRAECGAFVTLHKSGRLRGCIGHISSSKPLLSTVAEVAQASAFDDPRFPPVTREEAPGLRIEVSVLSPFRPVTDVNEIRVGEHGVLLRQGYHSGLLLPQVATEQGWNREELLDHTCLKAGVAAGSWRDSATRLEIFSALVFGEEEA